MSDGLPTGVVSRINLFPIKSLPGVDVQSCRVLPTGALEWDRRLALQDESGKLITAKECDRLHDFIAGYDLSVPAVSLSTSASRTPRRFHLLDDRDSLGDFLSCLLNQHVAVVEDTATGFPDDAESGGPTIIARATLKALTALFPLSTDDLRERFRTNIEVDGVPAFWEDVLYDGSAEPAQFSINGVVFGGTHSCARCRVPARDPRTGEETQAFRKVLAMFRKETIPEWVPRELFDHYYRLATNTVLIDPGPQGTIRVGDRIRIPRLDQHRRQSWGKP